MPQNDDYLSKRHERREAARKKREAEARRVKRTLFAAVLALVLCGVAFHNLTKDVVKEKPDAFAVLPAADSLHTEKAHSH